MAKQAQEGMKKVGGKKGEGKMREGKEEEKKKIQEKREKRSESNLDCFAPQGADKTDKFQQRVALLAVLAPPITFFINRIGQLCSLSQLRTTGTAEFTTFWG